jgi:hypothetical protein
MLAGLYGDSSDSESFDVESQNEDAKGRLGGQAMLFSGNQLLNKGKSKRRRADIS